MARLVLGTSIGVNGAVCFHAQQAAEKALEARLVLLGVDYSGALIGLSPWSVAGRYPEDIEVPSADTARRMVEVAQVVIDQVRAALAAE